MAVETRPMAEPNRTGEIPAASLPSKSGKISRRGLLAGAAGLAGAALAGRSRESSANADAVAVGDGPINLDDLRHEEFRPGLLKGFLQTKLDETHESLAGRQYIPITGLKLNTDENFMSGFPTDTYRSARLRLDMGVLRGFALLETVRQDTEIAAATNLDVVPWSNLVAGQRANRAEVPVPISDEEIAAKIKDPHFRIPVAVFSPDEYGSITDFNLEYIAPQVGLELQIARDLPEPRPRIGQFQFLAYEPYAVDRDVILDGEPQKVKGLGLKLWVEDGQRSQRDLNLNYSSLPVYYFELASIGLIPPMIQYYGEPSSPEAGFTNPIWDQRIQRRSQGGGFFFYDGLVSQFQGPADSEGLNNTAPVLHIESPVFEEVVSAKRAPQFPVNEAGRQYKNTAFEGLR